MKEFGHCLVWKQESLCSAHFPLKSEDSSSVCNGFAMSFGAATSWLLTPIQRDFCTGFGDAAANPAWFMEESSAFSSWCFLTAQDADPATHKAWALLGQPQRLHSPKDSELQLPEPGEAFLVSQ